MPVDSLASNAAVAAMLRSPLRLTRAAATCAALSCALPILLVRRENMIGSITFWIDGMRFGGGMAWLMLLAFVLSALSRRRSDLEPYSALFDIACFVCWGWIILDALLAQMMDGGGPTLFLSGFMALASAMVTPTEHVSLGVGVLFFAAAPILLFLARRGDRATIPS